MNWNIKIKGRAWNATESEEKIYLTPRKIETYGGKLFYNEKERLNMLAMLLENVGLEKALKLCDAKLVEEAIEKIKKK